MKFNLCLTKNGYGYKVVCILKLFLTMKLELIFPLVNIEQNCIFNQTNIELKSKNYMSVFQ